MSRPPTRCRYRTKATYWTRRHAREAMASIRQYVESKGEVYTTLYPYPCPDEQHWHLTHYRQGRARCPVCNHPSPAWNTGEHWVISAHGDECSGQGKTVGYREAS